MSVTSTDLRPAVHDEITRLVHHHPVVVDNTYTRWFATGAATPDEVRHLTVQFSVFSHQFVEAQLRKVINAADLETYRAGKEILMNELGVIFKPPVDRARPTTAWIRPWWRPRVRWTAAASASRPPTSSGWCASRAPSDSASTSSGSAATPPPPRCTSATNCCGSTAARTPRSQRVPPTRSSTGPRPGSGRSSSRACGRSQAGSTRPQPGLLDVARQGRGPARGAHRRRVGAGDRAARF